MHRGLVALKSVGRCVMFANRARSRIGRGISSFVVPCGIMRSNSVPEGIMAWLSSGPEGRYDVVGFGARGPLRTRIEREA